MAPSIDSPAAVADGYVTASLNYLESMDEPLVVHMYAVAPGQPQSNGIWKPVSVPIHDLRPEADKKTVEANGFALVQQPTSVKDWTSEEEILKVYYPEVEALIKSMTGAQKVVVFDHTIRRRRVNSAGKRIDPAETRDAPDARQPVFRVHNDYTVKSGPQRVKDLMGDEAEALLKGRFIEIQVWRPLRGPVLDAPLAVCDSSTVEMSDFVTMSMLYPDRTGETYALTYSPRHKWYYVPRMEADEALVFKCYDSKEDSPVRFTPHSGFEDPNTPEDALPRQSIEIRTLAFFASEQHQA